MPKIVMLVLATAAGLTMVDRRFARGLMRLLAKKTLALAMILHVCLGSNRTRVKVHQEVPELHAPLSLHVQAQSGKRIGRQDHASRWLSRESSA